MQKHEHNLETTASESSFQNAIAEQPHPTLGNVMWSMLTATNTSNAFCADALPHAVCIKSRMPHTAMTRSPHEKCTGRKPNLLHLHVFGSRVIVKNQGDQLGKLNKHITIGTFLCFGGSKCNIIFYNNKTHQI